MQPKKITTDEMYDLEDQIETPEERATWTRSYKFKKKINELADAMLALQGKGVGIHIGHKVADPAKRFTMSHEMQTDEGIFRIRKEISRGNEEPWGDGEMQIDIGLTGADEEVLKQELAKGSDKSTFRNTLDEAADEGRRIAFMTIQFQASMGSSNEVINGVVRMVDQEGWPIIMSNAKPPTFSAHSDSLEILGNFIETVGRKRLEKVALGKNAPKEVQIRTRHLTIEVSDLL